MQDIIASVVEEVVGGLKPVKRSTATLHKTEKLLYGFPNALADMKRKAAAFTEDERLCLGIKVTQISNALQSIADDPYYDIIRFRYFRDMPWVEIADRFEMSVSSVRYNKKRLLGLLSIRLFPDEVICDMWAGV